MRVTLYRDHPAEGWPSMDRYAESLAEALPGAAPPGWQIGMPMPPQPWPGTYGRLLSRLVRYPPWAAGQQGDVNHVLDHSYGHLLFGLHPTRTVITVHDVAPLRFPGRRAGLSGLAWRLAWQGVRKAQHIVVDSAFIAGELATLFRAPRERFTVVGAGVASGFAPQPPAVVNTVRGRYVHPGQRLLLHVGHTQPRKNLPALLQALALLRQQGLNVVLLQVGGVETRELRELKAWSRLTGERAVCFTGPVPDPELPALYSAADVFVFPSLYEGFGLPVLEAMACGTPVVAACAASLPEVVGDAGLLADPHSPEELARAIARVLKDDALTHELRQRGLARAREFTWQRAAARLAEVYERVAGGG